MSAIMDGDGGLENPVPGTEPVGEAVTAPVPSVETPDASGDPLVAHRWARSGVRLKTVFLGLIFVILSFTKATAVWIDVDVDGPSVLAGVIGVVGVLMVVGAITGTRRREH